MSIEAIGAVSKMRFTNSTTKLVLMALANYADEWGYVYLGQKQIAEFCGIARETALRHLKKLEDEGYIYSQQFVRKDGGKSTKAYYLTNKVGQI